MFLYETHTLDINKPYSIREITNLTWELHIHRAYECIYVLAGEINCKVEHTNYVVTAGQIVFIMPNQLHSILTSDSSQIVIILFSPELIGSFHNTYQHMAPQKSCFPFLVPEKAACFPFHNGKAPENIFVLKALLYKICGELLHQTEFVPQVNSSNDILIYNLLDYINKHYTTKCSLNIAAKECCCDYYHASKTFIKYTGLYFVNYVNTLRVHRACYLIKNTNDSFLNISLICGFTSLRSFNRNFLQLCDCTPSEYRKKSLY